MININEIKCCGCHACYSVCPVSCITMQPDNEGFLYPVIDVDRCINCNKCNEACPELGKLENIVEPNIYACYRNDFDKRLESASGGVFSVIAEYVIQQDGVVFGAAFDDSWQVNHISVDNVEELIKLKGSKYVQSRIGDTYIDAKEQLELGKLVLFSGTPCQIQGLKKYLGKEYSNLITIDLVCHGVPSPKVWDAYVNETAKDKELISFKQRDKSKGIYDAPSVFVFSDGSEIREKYSDSKYIKGFIQNLYLRPSCYDCSFKGFKRVSDLTIGDFWGLERFKPDFVDQYGISLLLVHSEKGNSIFNAIKNELTSLDCKQNYNMTSAENPCIISSVSNNDYRESFFNKLSLGFNEAVTKYIIFESKPSKFKRALENTKHMLWVIKHKITD